MAPMEQTPNSYVRTAIHPIHRWEFSYHMQWGTVASLTIHHDGDPESMAIIADYLVAVQQGLQHLLMRELLPEGLAITKDAIMNQLTHHIKLARPDLIDQYRLMAMVWAESLCVQEAMAIHAAEAAPVAPER